MYLYYNILYIFLHIYVLAINPTFWSLSRPALKLQNDVKVFSEMCGQFSIKPSMLQQHRTRHYCWTAACLQTYLTMIPHCLWAQHSTQATLSLCMSVWMGSCTCACSCMLSQTTAGKSFPLLPLIFFCALLQFSLSLF